MLVARSNHVPSACNKPSAKPFRSEEHTSELQSRQYLVFRLLLEQKTYVHRLDQHFSISLVRLASERDDEHPRSGSPHSYNLTPQNLFPHVCNPYAIIRRMLTSDF